MILHTNIFHAISPQINHKSLLCSRFRRIDKRSSLYSVHAYQQDKSKNAQDLFQELNDDPILSKVFSKPAVQKAIKDIQNSPMNISKYKNNPEVMQVLNRLLGLDLSFDEQQILKDLNMSPPELLSEIASKEELTNLLLSPIVQRAINEMNRNPEAYSRYANVPEVKRVMELLDEIGSTIDV